MFIPDDKTIEVVGFRPYLRAIGFWIEGVGHWAGYHINEAKLHMPFFSKELCIMRQWYHLTIASQALYAISLLTLDEDSVEEFDNFQNEMVDIWQQTYGTKA